MGFKIVAFVCIVCVAVPYTVEAGCKDDVMKENKSCFDSYNAYLANLGSSGVDMSQITTFLCNEEGMAATKCLMPLLENCDELKTDPQYQVFSMLEQMGGCASEGGGGGMGGPGPMPGGMNDPCNKATMECMSMGDSEEADKDMANGSTPFTNFPKQIKMICVDFKSKFDCMKKNEKECPGLEDKWKQMYTSMQPTMSGGDQPIPSFDSQKQFIMNQCPKFPTDFYTNACLKDNLETKQFTDCYMNVTGGHKMVTCEQYQGAFKCVTTALETCGEKQKSAFTSTANFYLEAMFKDGCKVEMKKDTSGARVFVLSLYTLFVGVFLTVFV